MGLILGDGSLRYTESQKGFSFSTNDEELLSPIEKELNDKWKDEKQRNEEINKKKRNLKNQK